MPQAIIHRLSNKDLSKEKKYLGDLLERCVVGLQLINDTPLPEREKQKLNHGWFYTHAFISFLHKKFTRVDIPIEQIVQMRFSVLPELVSFHVDTVLEAMERNKYAKHYQTEWKDLWCDTVKVTSD
ncbi:MAG: hypothetical protein AAFN92_12400 [Bacteroidota bacterium]